MVRYLVALSLLVPLAALAGEPVKIDESGKPKVAFFPLGGNAKETLRDRCGQAMRLKLDRTEKYDVIDGPRMKDLAEEVKEPITFATASEPLRDVAKLVNAEVLVWGDLTNGADGTVMKVKVLDLRGGPSSKPREITKVIKEPTDVRFVTEEVLETLPGIDKFAHPVEDAVFNDATADMMWKEQPNMVLNPDFSGKGQWSGIYTSEYYEVPDSTELPAVDKVVIYKMPDGNRVLAMNLSRTCAENNGMACLSQRIEIAQDTRYRLSFRYKSDGPKLHVFVKGYTMDKDINGQKAEREIYRRQVPPTGATNGEWVTIIDDLNPQHIVFPVQYLKIDLYAYLHPGVVMFDDVILKPVGKQTRKAEDKAIKKPIDRPKGAK